MFGPALLCLAQKDSHSEILLGRNLVIHELLLKEENKKEVCFFMHLAEYFYSEVLKKHWWVFFHNTLIQWCKM